MLEIRPISVDELRQAQSGLAGRVPVEQAPVWERFADAQQHPLMERIMWLEDGRPVAVATLYQHEVRGAKFLWARRGPVWSKQPSPEREQEALDLLRDYVSAKHKEIVFIRLHAWYQQDLLQTPMRVLGYDRTAIIDGARGNRDAALAAMPSVGRKLVRRAQKLFGEAGGIILEETGLRREDFREFYALLVETAERDGFTPHEEAYYWSLLSALGPEHARLFSARVDGQLACWDLVIVNGKNIGALYGASSEISRETRATVLLDFEVACMLGAEGKGGLDLMGVHSPSAPGLYNVGRYKLQFAQNYTDVAGLWEMPVKPAVYGSMRAALRGRTAWRSASRRLRLLLDRSGERRPN